MFNDTLSVEVARVHRSVELKWNRRIQRHDRVIGPALADGAV